MPFLCLPQLLEYYAKWTPEAPAILAPGRTPLSYARLHRQVEDMGRALRTMGIGRRDRVAVILPNGPELMVAILTVAAGAVCAPMNPTYETRELDRYFADLQPRALLTAKGFESPAREVALARDIPIIELNVVDAPEAGLFTLIGESAGPPFQHDSISSDDVMMLLFTSGTTAWPKIVPLTHANICKSACSSASTLALEPTDRCLNVLPLFHGHGLTATVIASLAAGASVVATPGCDVKSFFGWLTTFRPTWYSAVPTMHQAILAQTQHYHEHVATHRLRLIRSASAPLAPRVLADLERIFKVAVIEFYGMTETASSPIACNPLPPRRRKAGSVGIPVELDVAIMDSDKKLLPRGETGEVVVRGESVIHGYANGPAADQAAFVGGWFRTGDLGFFDDDGYLFLTGRSKEIINRGGEKITPWEVDEVLMEHPSVAEAVTFAVPHPTLGEDVGAAVVLRPQIATTPKEIRQFVMGRVADFKVPRQVLVVSELPRGPTGKVNRIGLAAAFGLEGGTAVPQAFVAPSTSLEKVLSERWAEVLKVERVGIHDDFFALGGDSLLFAHLVTDVYETIQLEMDVSRFFDAPTIAETARYLETLIHTDRNRRPSLIIASRPRRDAVLASIAQERLWQLQHLLRGKPFFNVFCPLRLTSVLDVAILERSISEIVQRHEVLRTTFAIIDGRCVQVIDPQLTVDLAFEDLDSLSESKKESVGHQIITEEALYTFDLTQGPLFRFRLLRLAERVHLLLFTVHGIIVDGWSLGVILDDLFTVYDTLTTGSALPLPSLSIQYADFAHWQRHWQSQADIVAQLSYWREQLRGPLPAMQLVTAPFGQTIDRFQTAQQEVKLPAILYESIKSFSLREGGTVFMALVSAFNTLLQRYLGLDDLRVATLVANRNRPGTDRLVGPLANTVVLRTNLGGDPSLREVMRRVRATTIAALANQDLPFDDLIDALNSERGLKPMDLSPVMIALHNSTLRPIGSSRHTIAFEEATPNMLGPLLAPMAFDISLMLRESPEGLTGSCIYKPHRFDGVIIGRLIRDFQEVLQKMVTQPELSISTILVSF
jgi:acyl-CoA synthetase (AMP-forming)/AMP-acid ligase II